jgi:hypothetical protein
MRQLFWNGGSIYDGAIIAIQVSLFQKLL